MNKLLKLLGLLTVSLVLAFVLSACGGGDDDIYTVTFKVGEEKLCEVTASEGDPVSLPDSPQKNGYEFDGWKTENGDPWDEASHTAGNITVYASWKTPIKYSATFKADGEIVGEIEFTAETESITPPNVPAKAGYSGEWESFTLGTENITVNAVYTPVTYKITFIADGAKVDEIDFTVETESVTPPAIPEKNGYNGAWESFTLGAENLTVNAIYTPITYKITFIADGAKVDEIDFTVETESVTPPKVPAKAGYSGEWENYTLGSESITVNAVYTVIVYTIKYNLNLDGAKLEGICEYTVESEITLPLPTHELYAFAGWYGSSELSGDNISKIEIGTTGNAELYARWTPKEYTATFTADGVIVSKVGFTTESESIGAPKVPEKLGYSGAWESFTLGTENITVNAVYTPVTYKITFMADGAKVDEIEFTVETESVTPPALPSKTGYTAEWEAFDLSLESKTVNAVYTPITYKITFMADGAKAYEIEFTVETESITPPAIPSKTGYTAEWASFDLSLESKTVNAVYTPIIYKITFMADGAKVDEVEFTIETESVTPPAIPSKTGYTAKWEAFDLSLESKTVNALYTPTTYKITFMADGVKVDEVNFTVETENITPPDIPAKVGYTAEWEGFELSFENKTVNAVYTPITYKITYETNLPGVSGSTLKTFTIESETFDIPALRGDNYNFIGWYLDEALTTSVTKVTNGAVGDIHLYAKLECTHSYKSSIVKEAEILNDGLKKFTCELCRDSYTEVIPATKSIKLLAIGNSYSIDAMQYLYGILKQAGVENITLGNLYIAGCSLDTHWANITEDADAYRLYLSSESKKTMVTSTNSASISYALELYDWDIVTLQQRSSDSGKPETYENLQNIIDYVKSFVPDAKLYWHMTWAYSPTRSKNYEVYGRTQIGMYNAISSTVQSIILENSDIVGVLPVGTAIQNLRTSLLGDDLTRDDTHLSYSTGRYTAALTWAKILTGCDISLIDGTPSYSEENEKYGDEINANMVYIREAVSNAFEAPFSVTNSIYPPTEDGGDDDVNGGEGGENSGENGGDEGGEVETPTEPEDAPNVQFNSTLSPLTDGDKEYLIENGYDPDDYKALDIIFYDNHYYDSGGSSKIKLGIDNLANRFVGTQMLSRYELIVGSLIRLDVGQYRPEAWTALDAKTPSANRPANVNPGLTVVTEEWWGEFNYRAFNLRKSGTITTDDICAGFRIYVPVVKTTDLTDEDIAYLESAGLDASEYKVLDFEYFVNQYYDASSSKPSKLATPKEGSSTYGRFISIELLSRYDLTIGSIIKLESGYSHRAEGWYDLDERKTSDEREPNVNDSVVEVTEEWWEGFVFRGINIQKKGYKIPDVDISGIRIYVKI